MTPDDATLASRLAATLPTARWFGDKAERIEGVTLHERRVLPTAATAAEPPAELALADVRLAGQATAARYVAIVAPDGGDAAATPQAARGLLGTVLTGVTLAGRHGAFIGRPAGRREGDHLPPAAVTVSPIGSDASNTSLVIHAPAASWVIKLFRRCREGIQPEVELGEFFAATSWPGTPRFCGWLGYEPAREGGATGTAAAPTAIATVHEFTPACVTAWERLVTLLSAAAPGGDWLAGPAGKEVVGIVTALGRTTAEMHRELASRPDLPAFAPEPATAAWRQAAAVRMREHAAGVCTSITSRLASMEPAIARRLGAVLAAWPRLERGFARLGEVARSAANIRVHGDYHLGQVLVAEHDPRSLVAEHDGQVLVIDFEGEPGRTLAERREKTSAAKDVAGMCRSFDYLLRHVAKTTGRPYAAADLRRFKNHFLAAYREVAAGSAWWPADPAAADGLLAVFELDKAIYELAYELNNRPDWIDVPLAAVEEAAALDR
jgi:trehalose synthase-fused probable maltokinase